MGGSASHFRFVGRATQAPLAGSEVPVLYSRNRHDLERCSRLGLTWANGVWLEGCPRVKRAQPTLPGARSPVRRALWLLSAVFLDDLQGEVLELGEQGAEFSGVVEQRLVFGELAGG